MKRRFNVRKFITFSLIMIGCLLILPIEASAFTTLNEVKTTQDLHEELKEQNIIYLDQNGLIVVPDKADTIGINRDLYEEYIQIIERANQLIKDDFISFDNKLNLEPFTQEEIANKVFLRDQNNNNYYYKIFSQEPETIRVVDLVESNRSELEDFYNTIAVVNPGDAYVATVGYWVGKVSENGSWDYKVQPGFAPWDRDFYAIMYNGFSEIHNSKWLGNYNYGYTGQFLFSLDILLIGGDAISYLLNWEPDAPDVKNTIERGFAEAYYFWEVGQ